MEEKALGKRLQQARQKAGLTQQQLCEQTGLAYSTLAKIERGAITSPSVFTVAAIAAATSTPVSELLGDLAPSAEVAGPKRSKTGISFVYFDVGGTLVHSIQGVFSQIARDADQTIDTVEMFFWRNYDAVSTGRMSQAEFNKLMADNLGFKGFNWEKYYVEYARPIKPAHKLLEWTAQHYTVGLLTNNMSTPIMVTNKNERLIPEVEYKAIVSSSEVGVLKPDPRIYKIAEAEAGVRPSEILLVDNELPNLVAAERAGWHTTHFNDLKPAESAARIQKLLEF